MRNMFRKERPSDNVLVGICPLPKGAVCSKIQLMLLRDFSRKTDTACASLSGIHGIGGTTNQ